MARLHVCIIAMRASVLFISHVLTIALLYASNVAMMYTFTIGIARSRILLWCMHEDPLQCMNV